MQRDTTSYVVSIDMYIVRKSEKSRELGTAMPTRGTDASRSGAGIYRAAGATGEARSEPTCSSF
jgi:hypothetical protein